MASHRGGELTPTAAQAVRDRFLSPKRPKATSRVPATPHSPRVTAPSNRNQTCSPRALGSRSPGLPVLAAGRTGRRGPVVRLCVRALEMIVATAAGHAGTSDVAALLIQGGAVEMAFVRDAQRAGSTLRRRAASQERCVCGDLMENGSGQGFRGLLCAARRCAQVPQLRRTGHKTRRPNQPSNVA
jgi:hypothetical protein